MGAGELFGGRSVGAGLDDQPKSNPRKWDKSFKYISLYNSIVNTDDVFTIELHGPVEHAGDSGSGESWFDPRRGNSDE